MTSTLEIPTLSQDRATVTAEQPDVPSPLPSPRSGSRTTRFTLGLLLLLLVLCLAGDGAARIASGIVFTGDFESGTTQPWTQPACSNYGYATNNLATFGPFYADRAGKTQTGDTVPAGQGSYFGAYSVPADATHKQRCQTVISRPTTFNADDYYTLMVYVPVGWQDGHATWGPTIAELNYQTTLTNNSGKALALNLRTDHVTIAMSTGKMNATAPIFSNTSDADQPANCRGTLLPCAIYAIPPGKLVQGKWNEIIVHDYFTPSNTGVVEAWYRVAGQTTWTKSVDLHNVPTLLSDATHSGAGTSLEAIGAYRGPGATIPTTIYLDGFTRGTSFASAASAMP